MSEEYNLLPSATQQEKDVIGVCLAEGSEWWSVVHRMAGDNIEELFWDTANSLAAQAMTHLLLDDKPVSLSSVGDLLSTSANAQKVMPPSIEQWLVNMQALGTIKNLEELTHTVEVLIEKRQLRKLSTEAERVSQLATKPGATVSDMLTAVGELGEIASDSGGDEMQHFGEIITEIESEESVIPMWQCTTGLSDLDAILGGGYEPGRLYVFAARPKVGKTTFTVSSILDVLSSNENAEVLVVSTEISKLELYSKLLSAQAWVLQSEIKEWIYKRKALETFEPQEQEALIESNNELKAANFHGVFYPKLGSNTAVNSIMKISSKIKDPSTPFVVFVDYLGQLAKSTPPAGRNTSTAEHVGNVVMQLKMAAETYKCAIVLLAQVNREGAEVAPQAHHLKDSGEIEAGADAVIMLNRQSLQDPEKPDYIIDFDVAISRVGAPGLVQAAYYPEYQSIQDLDREWDGAAAQPAGEFGGEDDFGGEEF